MLWHVCSTLQDVAYALPTISINASRTVYGGHGAREANICIEGRASARAHPTNQITSRAEHPRRPRLRRDHAPLGCAAGDLEHELLARRFLELRPLLDRNDERARPADDAVLVIDVEILELHLPHAVADLSLEHDRQPVDRDAGAEHVVAHQRDRRAHVVDAIARGIDHAAQA